jgi:NAD(P)H dehydrogenase (quinone)
MVRILVLYFSRTGNTKAMAEEVAAGAREGGAEVVLKEITQAKVEELVEADGIIIGSPS